MIIPLGLTFYNDYRLTNDSLEKRLDEKILTGKNFVERIYESDINRVEGLAVIKASDTSIQETVATKKFVAVDEYSQAGIY